MRYQLSDAEWTAIKPMLPNKPRGAPRVKFAQAGSSASSRKLLANTGAGASGPPLAG